MVAIFDSLKKISDVVWEIPKDFKQGMRVPARIYGNQHIVKGMDKQVYDQITNVATLPGIVNSAFCMPDGHSGYGFPVGGVAAFDPDDGGIISPGGIGYDINCGMRLMLTDLTYKDVKPKLKELVDLLFKYVPAGVGSSAWEEKSGFFKLSKENFIKVIESGAEWCVENGYGWKEDLERTELNGIAREADVSKISPRAIKRGIDQVGTLGSGNHYLEIQRVDKGNIFDDKIAKKMGLFPDQMVIMFHCGSRGFGHQVASDYIEKFLGVMEKKYKIHVPDPQLACAPFNSTEGQDYYKAMMCGVNMSFANRQMIMHRIREAFSKVYKQTPEKLGMHMVYDIAHNRGSLETHKVDGKKKQLIVHRKGATSAFGPGHPEVQKIYRDIGQPIIIGGSMETGSYLLLGTEDAAETFYSTCHGSGRIMSRTKARHEFRGEKLLKDMEKRGIYVRSTSMSGLAEEAGKAYKDIDDVIDSVNKAGISKKVVKLIPLGNVKG